MNKFEDKMLYGCKDYPIYIWCNLNPIKVVSIPYHWSNEHMKLNCLNEPVKCNEYHCAMVDLQFILYSMRQNKVGDTHYDSDYCVAP